MLPTGIAKLFRFQTLRMLPLILRSRVVPILAIAALQSNDFPHSVDPFPKLKQRYSAG
jgi:hypothetical protein